MERAISGPEVGALSLNKQTYVYVHMPMRELISHA